MPKRWQDDATLVDGLADNLLGLLPVFPKGLVRVDELMHTYGMPLSHMQILILLSGGGLSVGQLSQRLGIAKPNITPLVDALQSSGLVERVRSTVDKRVVSVRLLPEGETLLSKLRQDVARQIAAWRCALSRSEAKTLSTALASVIRLAEGLEESKSEKS